MATDTRTRESLERVARNVGDALRGVVPPGVGFMFNVFEFGGPGGWSTYVCNGQRADMVAHLRELADRLERGSDG